jgi:hypothetical protein
MLAGQPSGGAGVDESGQRVDQDRAPEVGQITSEFVESVGVKHLQPTPGRGDRFPISSVN